MSKRVTKVKHKNGETEVHLEEKVDDKTTKTSVFVCGEKPHPDFDLSFSGLIPVVYDLLELPQEWRPGCMKITGVTFSLSEESGVEGAVITGQVKMEKSQSPFSFNTPHVPFDQYSPTGSAPTMSHRGLMALEKLRAEALAYMEGKRAQMEFAGLNP